MDSEIYNVAMQYCYYSTGATALATIFSLSFFYICHTRQMSIYRRYVLVYVLSNLIYAIVYNVTYVNTFGWDNSLILFADGYFAGPRAIGIQMIFSTTPAAILALLKFYRYAQVTNFTRFEFLSSSFSIIYCSFWLSLNALFHYSVATILFQTDGDAIDQTADLFHWILEKGRDYGFEQCIGTYWMNGTFQNGKWKLITGLVVLYVSYISSLLVNAYISFKIRETERSRFKKNLFSNGRFDPRHNLFIWSQLALVSVTVSLPRLIITLIPFIHDSRRGELNAYLAYFAMFSVPLRPILSNITVILMVKYSDVNSMLIFDISEYFILACTLLTVATTVLIVIGIFNQPWYNFRFYKYYLLAYAINNCLDSVVYQFTLVFSVITRNTFVLMANGLFKGPRAIGIHLIVNQQTFIFISFLYSFRFCMHCKPNMFEFLIQRSAIVYHSLWISMNALLTYSIPALFFLPDADSIQQIFALLNNMLDLPRDTGYSMTLGTYWASETFIGLKAKPIIGLGILYFLTFMNTFWALFFTWKIVKTVRRSTSYSSRKYALEKQHLLSLWIQFLISFLPLVVFRLGWATIPFFTRVYYYNFLNFAFGYTVLYGVPLRSVIANIALLITVREIRISLLNCFGCSDHKITNVQSTESSHA